MINGERIKSYLYVIGNLLIVAFGFFLFVDWKISRAILIGILFIWIITGDYKEKFQKIFSNKIVITFLVFIGLFIFGLLWTEDFYAGRKIIERPLLYLISPLMVSLYKKEFLKYYLFSALFALVYTGILTLLIDMNLINMIYTSDKSPFVNRVYLEGMLLFALGYFLSKINIKFFISLENIVWIILSILMIYTLVQSGSRMGTINLVVVFSIFIYYKFKITKKNILVVLVLIIGVSYGFYKTNSKVGAQVDRTIHVLKMMDLNKQVLKGEKDRRTSITCRFEFWYHAYTLGIKHFPFGVGTGDGILELKRYMGNNETEQLFRQCMGNGSGQFNPHNMYIFMFMQFGILGVMVLLWMLYTHLKIALTTQSIPFISLVIVTILTLFSVSELFTTVFYIPFYGYMMTLLTLYYSKNKV